MIDIVDRLRELEAVESELACECDCPPEATANYRYAMTCADAVDEITRLRAALSDPVAVHINMLRGVIAKPTLAQIVHLYGEDALRAAIETPKPPEAT